MRKIGIFLAILCLPIAFPLVIAENPALEKARNLYKEPKVYPPAEHPRVLIRKKDLPELQKKLTAQECVPVLAEVRKLAADKTLDGRLSPEKNRFAKGVHDEKNLYAIQSRAFLYLVDNDRQMGVAAISGIKNYLNSCQYKSELLDASREIGFTLYTMALVYDWCYDLLSAEDKAFFIRQGEKFIAVMEPGLPPVKQGNITGHGGEAMIFRDILSYAIAVYDEAPLMYRIAAGRYFQEMVEPRNFFYPAGRHHQGSMYGPYRYMWDIFSAWLFRRMSGIEVFVPAAEDQIYQWLYTRLPDGSVFPDGDNWWWNGNYMSFPQCTLYHHTYFNSPLSKGEFLRQRGMEYALTDPVTFLLFCRPELGTADFKSLPLTHYFPFPLGAMVARSGWESGRKSNTAVVRMNGSDYHFNNHHHLDHGSFLIYFRGPLAVDAGQYSHYGSEYDWSFAKDSISHNVLLVRDPAEKAAPKCHNSGGQKYPFNRNEPWTMKHLMQQDFKVGQTLSHGAGPDGNLPVYSHIKAEMSKAYGGRVKDYVRSFVYFNLNNPSRPGVLIVFDRAESTKKEFEKYWTINSLFPPVQYSDRFNLVSRDGRLEVFPLLPAAENRKITVSPSLEFFGKKLKAPFPQLVNGDCRRTMISPRQPAEKDVFLNVLLMGMAGDEPSEKPRLISGSGGAVGAEIAGVAAVFSKEKRYFDSDFSFELEKGGNVLLTDLSPGFWTVERDGKVLFYGEAKKDNETLFFVGGKGSYRIRKGKFGTAALPDYSSLKAIPSPGSPEKEVLPKLPLRHDMI